MFNVYNIMAKKYEDDGLIKICIDGLSYEDIDEFEDEYEAVLIIANVHEADFVILNERSTWPWPTVIELFSDEVFDTPTEINSVIDSLKATRITAEIYSQSIREIMTTEKENGVWNNND